MELQNTQTEELSNDLIKFKIHKKPACRVEYEVTVSKTITEAAHSSAIKNVAKEITLPGFRKGKAPNALVLKNYPNEVDKKWQECIATDTFRECKKLSNIPMLNGDAKVLFEMKKHSADGAEIILSFETEPVIPVVDPKQYHLSTVERPAVDETKVEETIRQILFFFAQWKSVQDRPVQEGDFVTLDVDIIETDPPTPLFSRTRFEVTNNSMAQWMKDLVIGKNLHDSIEGVSTPDADLPAKEKEAFQEKKVRIRILAIDTATLPEITEEFLKNLGVSSQEELKKNIETLLNKQADAHVREKQREHVNEFLLNQYPFDLPKSLIDKETQFRLQQLSADESFMRYWQTLSQDDKKKTIDNIHLQSEKAVRMFYLCRKLIHEAKISISPQDLPPPPSTPLEALLNPNQMLQYHQQPDVRQAEALSRLILEKAEDYVIEHAS